jgi:hypothetical protein
MHQWTEGIQRRGTPEHAKSIRAGDVICYSLDIESCAMEASRLRGFYDRVAVEASVKRSGKLGAAIAFDLPTLSPFLASLSSLSLAFWVSLSLCLIILFFSFAGSRLMSTSTSSSCSCALSVPVGAPFESVASQVFLTSSS